MQPTIDLLHSASANKLYKESGSTLPFKDWISREKTKGKIIPNASASEEYLNLTGSDSPGGADKSTPADANILRDNLIRTVLFVAGALVIYKIWKNAKNA